MRSIERQKLETLMGKAIFPAIQVPEDKKDQVIRDVHFCYQHSGDPIGSGIIGVIEGFTNYLRFAGPIQGTTFSPSGDPEFYSYGINAIQQAIQAFELMDENPSLKAEFIEINKGGKK